MPNFIGVHSSLEGIKKQGLCRGRRGAFYHWGALQFESRKKTETLLMAEGVLLIFIRVLSNLDRVKNRCFGRGGRGASFHFGMHSSLEGVKNEGFVGGGGAAFFHWSAF